MARGVQVPKTPQKKRSNSTTPDTPFRRLKIHDEEADMGLDFARQANVEDLGPDVPELPVSTFLRSYVPDLRKGLTVTKITKHLKQSNVLTRSGWTDFSDKPKDEKGVHEDICFSTLKEVVDGIVEAGKLENASLCSLTFACIPNAKPVSTLRDSTNRPDCAIFLELRQNKPYWDDIAVSGEFKKDDGNTSESNRNRKQILWNLNQTMRNDPTRRSTLGFTIENTEMRLWHASRADVVVSEAFDFHDDHKTVIKFFAGIMFAEPEQLGWDPTIRRVRMDDTDQFDIQVHQKGGSQRIYRTVSMLSGFKADALRGRATRVWKCIEVDQEGRQLGQTPIVLKDMWIERDRDREGDIIQRLRNASDPKVRQTLQEVLLTVECHGDVIINGRADRTFPPKPPYTRFLLEKPIGNEEQKKSKAYASRRAVSSVTGGPGKKQKTAAIYNPKVHYRCVFKEVGTPLDEITSLQTVYRILGEVAAGLDALHKCGYVHRDPSSSNILVVNGSGKIADLEYAKRYDSSINHPVRSGVSYFTPVEIDSQMHVFRPFTKGNRNQAHPPRTGFIKYKDFIVFGAQNLTAKLSGKPSHPSESSEVVIIYLPIHDLESLWWIGVYFVVNRVVIRVGGGEPQAISTEQSNEHEELASQLFYNKHERHRTMTYPTHFESKIMATLHPSITVAGERLSILRNMLADAYATAEQDVTTMNFFKVADGLHRAFQDHFYNIAYALSDNDVQVRRYDELPVNAGIKRKADRTRGGPSKMRAVSRS